MFCVYVFSCLQLFSTPWTAARQAPLSMGFLRSGSPSPPQVDLANPETEPESPALADRFFTTEPLEKPPERTECEIKPGPQHRKFQLDVVKVKKHMSTCK